MAVRHAHTGLDVVWFGLRDRGVFSSGDEHHSAGLVATEILLLFYVGEAKWEDL